MFTLTASLCWQAVPMVNCGVACVAQGGEEAALPHKIATQRGKRAVAAVLQRAKERWDARHPCLVCRLPAHSRCSRCRQVWFCSKACQTLGWKTHKQQCKPAGSKQATKKTNTSTAAGGQGDKKLTAAAVTAGVTASSFAKAIARPEEHAELERRRLARAMLD